MNKFYGAHDQWTDLDKQNDVLITSTDGVIDSVKVNGEDYGGGGGSSDFSTAEVTVVNNTKELIDGLYVIVVDTPSPAVLLPMDNLSVGSKTYNVPLYKGTCYWAFPNSANVSVSGDIEWDPESAEALITGDCTITIA